MNRRTHCSSKLEGMTVLVGAQHRRSSASCEHQTTSEDNTQPAVELHSILVSAQALDNVAHMALATPHMRLHAHCTGQISSRMKGAFGRITTASPDAGHSPHAAVPVWSPASTAWQPAVGRRLTTQEFRLMDTTAVPIKRPARGRCDRKRHHKRDDVSGVVSTPG